MEGGPVPKGLFDLPNEILLVIFSLFPTRALLPLTPTCRQFHSLILRVIHGRLQVAAGLDGHALYLECHPPSARLTAAEFFCVSRGTEDLQELMSDITSGGSPVRQARRMSTLYSRFRPQRTEPASRAPPRSRPGDTLESRVYPNANTAASIRPGTDDIVSETVTVEAHELFSPLTTLAYLGKRETTRGMLSSIQEVTEGTICVWRDWLSRQCESKTWTDGETVAVHRDPTGGRGETGADRVAEPPVIHPTNDPSVLWIDTSDQSMGIKFRVKERKWRRAANPILYESDLEIAVSYQVIFEEVYVRTARLLLKLEEAEQQIANLMGSKAVVIGPPAGMSTLDVA